MTQTTTLAEQTADTLRDELRLGDYVSGERLVEMALAEKLNVSQNTVREALRILEYEGWLVKHSRRGVFVRTFTVEETHELCALVETLACLVLEWAIPALDETKLSRLRECIDAAGQHIRVMNWRGVMAAIRDFNAEIAAIAQRPQTAEILARLYNQACLLENIREMRMPRGLPGWGRAIKAYGALLAAIERSDVDEAQRILAAIIQADCAEVTACL